MIDKLWRVKRILLQFSSLIWATLLNFGIENFFNTACNEHFSIPCSNTHISLAHGLKFCSEYPEYCMRRTLF